MGHRANFIVVRDGAVAAYHDQWAALGCLEGFRAGPDDALDMLKEFEPTTELMDWAFAEGGYLLDFDDRTAIVFGSPIDESEFDFNESDDEPPVVEEPEEFDAEEYLRELAAAWTGWKLIYDDRGVDAFAEYLQSKAIEGITCQQASHPADVKPACEFQA